MPNDPFSTPTSGVKITDYDGSLLLLTPTDLKESVTTAYGDKEAVQTDLVALDGTDSGDVEEHSNVLIFQGVLIGQTKGKVNNGMVLGRLEQRAPSRPGQNGAWALADPTEEDKQVARDYLATKDPFNS